MKKMSVLAGALICACSLFGSPIKSDLGADGNGHLEGNVPSALNYVQDGLVAMWDGVENVGLGKHDFYAQEWIDLVQGAVLPVPINAQRYWEEDCWFRLVNWQVAPASAPVINAEFNGEWTIETVFSLEGISSLESSRNVLSFESYDIRVPFLRVNGSVSIFVANVFEYYLPFTFPFPRTTFSLTRKKNVYTIYVNGKIVGIKTSSSTADRNPYTVLATQNYMRDAEGNQSTSDNCAIRVYNKALSEEEVQLNFALDAVRFGIEN